MFFLSLSRSPMATFYDLKNPITSIYTVQNEGLMVTASEDKFIKVLIDRDLQSGSYDRNTHT